MYTKNSKNKIFFILDIEFINKDKTKNIKKIITSKYQEIFNIYDQIKCNFNKINFVIINLNNPKDIVYIKKNIDKKENIILKKKNIILYLNFDNNIFTCEFGII